MKPHVPSSKRIAEFTWRSMSLGIVLGIFFAVANAYLALRIGTTISASIPAAIVSMALLRGVLHRGTILENNIVQTVATVGEGLAAGVVFTIPALMMLGETPSIGRIFLLSMLGGILGILFMIPMRRYIIVQEHGTLPFPEGTACASILKAGESKSLVGAIRAGIGMLLGAGYKLCTGFFLLQEIPVWIFKSFQNTAFSIDCTPALLGVGYIIGCRIATVTFVGGMMAWWMIIPLIRTFGDGTVIFPSELPIGDLTADQIWSYYVRYIGAGAVAVGGLLGLVRIGPMLKRTVRASIKELFSGLSGRSHVARTDLDLPLSWLVLGSTAILLILWLFPGLPMNLFTILLLLFLGFFFVAVTSITVGIVGSTSNPVSGMTITTLLVTCVVFVLLGWTERIYLVSALTMAAVVNVAISLAGTTSQDLKTGFLLGATPRSQQIAEIIGVLLPAAILGFVIYLFNQAYTIGSAEMPAPQATLMSMIANGVISGELPYGLVGIGCVLGGLAALARIPVMPFAIGLYLPLSLSSGMMVGALVSAYVQRRGGEEVKSEGILISSGLIGGDACVGILIALLTVIGVIPTAAPSLLPKSVSLIVYLLLGYLVSRFVLPRKK